MATKWTRILDTPSNAGPLNDMLHRLNKHHKRYRKHSVGSLQKFLEKRSIRCNVGGSNPTLTLPRAFVYSHEIADKQLSAFFWLRHRPTNTQSAYCLALAGKKFPPNMGLADAAAQDFAEMLVEANQVCFDISQDIENPSLPIEVMCGEDDLGSNGEPTQDPDLAEFWNYALTQNQPGTATKLIEVPTPAHFTPNTEFLRQYPTIRSGEEVYRWIFHPYNPGP